MYYTTSTTGSPLAFIVYSSYGYVTGSEVNFPTVGRAVVRRVEPQVMRLERSYVAPPPGSKYRPPKPALVDPWMPPLRAPEPVAVAWPAQMRRFRGNT